MSQEFLTIQAAASGEAKARVSGLAYSGGKIKLPGWRFPVVVDLAGMDIPEDVPLLTNHENRTGSRVGLVRARVEEAALLIDGEILSTNGMAQGIVEQAKAGADWQLSIGADVVDSELVKGNRTINGQVQAGPFYHVRKSVLREVSVVAVGADATTRMKVAASFTLYGGADMEFEKWLEQHGIDAKGLDAEKSAKLREAFDKGEAPPRQPEAEPKPAAATPEKVPAAVPAKPAPAPAPAKPAAVVRAAAEPAGEELPAESDAKEEAQSAIRAERERVAAVQELCGGEFPKIEQEAIRLGWSAQETSQKVLKAMRENRPQADVGFSVSHARGSDRRTIEAALCLRAGIPEEAMLKQYGAQTLELAWQDRDMSMQQLFVECARMEGVTVPRRFSNDTIRAGFSTVSLPGILNNVANKKLLKSFQSQPVIATRLCSEGELNDFKESERYRLTDVGDLEQIAPDGELKHGALAEEKATNQLSTFGKIFSLTRQMIYNDDLGAFLKVPEGMGARAARKIDQLFFERLLANIGNLFSEAHGNYKAGADTALSADSLSEAVKMFLDQTDAFSTLRRNSSFPSKADMSEIAMSFFMAVFLCQEQCRSTDVDYALYFCCQASYSARTLAINRTPALRPKSA